MSLIRPTGSAFVGKELVECPPGRAVQPDPWPVPDPGNLRRRIQRLSPAAEHRHRRAKGSGLPTTVDAYKDISGAGLEVTDVTTDEASAQQRLEDRQVDVVLVAPDNVEQQFRAGKQSVIQVRVNGHPGRPELHDVPCPRARTRGQPDRREDRRRGQTYALSKGAPMLPRSGPRGRPRRPRPRSRTSRQPSRVSSSSSGRPSSRSSCSTWP